MSYDLMVFDPDIAPASRAEFMDWYEEQTEWEEDHSYDDPKVSSARLTAWFLEMIESYPALSGPYSKPGDPPNETDYSIGSSAIYAAFSWPGSAEFHDAVFRSAENHGVGVFEASSDQGTTWIPSKSGVLEVVHTN